MTKGKEVFGYKMTQEELRCRAAIDFALQGRSVALISSGDPGVYGMAGLALELAHKIGALIEIEVIPGISAANSLAALLGAPLTQDFATVSLSDILVPREIIEKRLEAVASADMVTVLYNPGSSQRKLQFAWAVDIFLKYRSVKTPVGIGNSISKPNEEIILTTLGQLKMERVDMMSTVIIGNSSSKIIDGRLITPRGYRL